MRYTLRTACSNGGLLEDVLLVIESDDGNVRLRMQWHGRPLRERQVDVQQSHATVGLQPHGAGRGREQNRLTWH